MEPPRRDTLVATPPPHLSSLVDTYPAARSPTVVRVRHQSIASRTISTTPHTRLRTICEEPPLLLSNRPPKPSYPLPPLRLRGAERWRCQPKLTPSAAVARMSNKKKKQRAKRKYKQQQQQHATRMLLPRAISITANNTDTTLTNTTRATVAASAAPFVDVPLDDDDADDNNTTTTTTPKPNLNDNRHHPPPRPSSSPSTTMETTDVADVVDVTDEFEVVCAAEWAEDRPSSSNSVSDDVHDDADESRCVIS